MKARLAIGALIALNVVLGAVIAYNHVRLNLAQSDLDRARSGIYADHVQQLRMDVPNQVVRVNLGISATAGGPAVIQPRHAGTILLTPRAAIQLEMELRNMIRLIHEAAAAVAARSTDESAEPQSPDQSL